MIAELFYGYIADNKDKVTSLEEVRDSLKLLAHPTSSKRQPTQLLKEYAQHIEEKIFPILDKIPSGFFVAESDKKEKILEVVFEDSTYMTQVMKKHLSLMSGQQLQNNCAKVFASIGMQSVIVQTARECDPKMKADIRKKYAGEYVVFQVRSGLLGGMRIIKDQKVSDASWLGKLTTLKKVANNL